MSSSGHERPPYTKEMILSTAGLEAATRMIRGGAHEHVAAIKFQSRTRRAGGWPGGSHQASAVRRDQAQPHTAWRDHRAPRYRPAGRSALHL
jgi:hypothetical protein